MSRRDLPLLSVATPVAPAPYAAVPDPYAHAGMSLMQLFAIAWAYRKITAITAVSVMVLAFAISKLMPKTYEATATLMVDYEVNDPLAGREFPISLMGSYMSTQTQLIKSPAVLLPVIERLKLTEDEEFMSGFSGAPGTEAEWVRSKMAKNVVAEQGNWGSQMIYVTYPARTAEKAALVSNTIADVYAEQTFLRQSGPQSERAQRYTENLAQLKKNVDAAQEALNAFQQRTRNLDGGGERIDLELEKLTNLEQRLLEAQEMRREAEARGLGSTASRDAVLNSGSVQTLKSQLAVLNGRMAEMRATLGPRHPQVLQTQSEINAVRRELDAEMAVYTGNTRQTIEAARAVEADLKRAVEEGRTRVLQKREVDGEGAKYKLALESAQTLYKQALEGYDSIVLSSGGKYSNVSFVSRATPPVKASKPKTMLNTALGLAIGLFLGIVGPLVYELLNRRVRCRDDLDRDFGLPVLVEFAPMPMPAGAK